MSPRPLVALLLAAAAPAHAQWTVVPTGTTAELRSLSVPSAGVVWAGGRGGVVVRSTDGGATWMVDTLAGAEDLFFVGIHAQDGRRATVLGTSFSGGRASIYRTRDGGRTWTETYRHLHPDVFLDGLAFWDAERGLAFGDPIDGAFVVLRTADGGATWTQVPGEALPRARPGEAAFAASGTAITTRPGGRAWFGTGGGPVARVFRTEDFGRTWTAAETPIPAGPSAGIFGLAFRTDAEGVAVGGDYRLADSAVASAARTADGGATWTLVAEPAPAGVKYGVARAGATSYVAVGPPGSGHSPDGGATWTPLDRTAFNTVAFAPDFSVGWAAGRDGRIARFRRP